MPRRSGCSRMACRALPAAALIAPAASSACRCCLCVGPGRGRLCHRCQGLSAGRRRDHRQQDTPAGRRRAGRHPAGDALDRRPDRGERRSRCDQCLTLRPAPAIGEPMTASCPPPNSADRHPFFALLRLPGYFCAVPGNPRFRAPESPSFCHVSDSQPPFSPRSPPGTLPAAGLTRWTWLQIGQVTET